MQCTSVPLILFKYVVKKKINKTIVIFIDYFYYFISACARVFHAAGARLILCSRNTQQLERIQFQLTNEVQVKNSLRMLFLLTTVQEICRI